MRKRLRFLFSLLGLFLAAGAGFGASASTNSSLSTSHALGFWAVAAPGQSFTAMVRDAAASPRRQPVIATIDAMLARMAQGHAVYLPVGPGPSVTSVAATSAELRAALSVAAMASIEPKDFLPNGFGCNEASDHYASWCGKYILRGEYCDAEGCTIEDQITTKITVDPGAQRSRVVYKSLYLPNNLTSPRSTSNGGLYASIARKCAVQVILAHSPATPAGHSLRPRVSSCMAIAWRMRSLCGPSSSRPGSGMPVGAERVPPPAPRRPTGPVSTDADIVLSYDHGVLPLTGAPT